MDASSAATRAQIRPEVLRAGTARPWGGTVVAAGAIVAAAVVRPTIGPSLAPADGLLVVVIILGAAVAMTSPSEAPSRLLRSAAPWLALIAASSALALTVSGLTSWALVSLAQTTYAMVLFLAAYALFADPRVDRRALVAATGAAIVVVTAGLLLTWTPATRPSGSFPNPNYPGHFLAMASILWWPNSRWLPRTRVAVAVVGVVGVVLTASFGALLMLGVASLAAAATWLRQRPWLVAIALAGLVFAAVPVAGALLEASPQALSATSTLNAERFERSQGTRLELWTRAIDTVPRRPLGLGPDGFRHDPELSGSAVSGQGLEPHNLYLAYLVERGSIGLVALLGLGVALWRHAPVGSVTRLLILAVAASNLVRETIHYRHMWLFLAVALALDLPSKVQREEARP
jgi:O-antigen ligase